MSSEVPTRLHVTQGCARKGPASGGARETLPQWDPLHQDCRITLPNNPTTKAVFLLGPISQPALKTSVKR